jgi:CubicO group peptidase (beta-lactamase class C family)
MSTARRRHTCILLAVSAACWLKAAPVEPDEIAETLRPIVRRAMEQSEAPGLAIAVLRDGRTVYREAIGVLDIASREQVTADTRFHLASVTKTFVATAVLQLAEQGRVDLDAHPRRYLPYFQPGDPRAEKVTIRQVLAHVSGLQKDDDTRFDNPDFDDGALERLVRESVSRPLDFAPGEKFGYSNLGYCVLGDIVAKVSGEAFEAYVKRHILEPLRMKSSSLLLSEAKRGPWARPYVVDDTYTVVPAPFHPYNRRRAPSNAMSSTLNDMVRWALVHMNRGELEGRRILKASTYDQMWRPAGESFPQIGLGWFLWKRGAEYAAGHNGSDTGFVADMELLPERGIGVIVLCNLDHGPYRPLMLAALDAALGKTPEVAFKPSLARDLYRVMAAQGAESAVARYREIKREQPGPYELSEWVLNGLGYKLAGSGRMQEAVRILRLNVEEYPASANVYDSLADVCYQSGDKACALENYRKALEKNATNKKAAEMLEKLGSPSNPTP